jgi:hypothetical protein
MVFGMVPVAIGHGDGGEVRAPMGVAIIGGLITSTALTLVVVPVVYTFMEAISQFGWRVVKKFSSGESKPEEHWQAEPSVRGSLPPLDASAGRMSNAE